MINRIENINIVRTFIKKIIKWYIYYSQTMVKYIYKLFAFLTYVFSKKPLFFFISFR